MQIKCLGSGSRGNCYHIAGGSLDLLIDCGISFRKIQEALQFRTSEIDACLISHEHGDHSTAAKDIMRAGIDVYASKGTINILGLSGHRLNVIKALDEFRLLDWQILPFGVKHDAAEPLGFLLKSGKEKLLYLTDTAYVEYRIKGLTHILIECNYEKTSLKENVNSGGVDRSVKNRVIRSHMSLKTVKQFFLDNDLGMVEEIHLLHLSDKNSDEKFFKEEIQKITGKPVYIANEKASS